MSKKNTSEITLTFPNPFEILFDSIETIRENASTLFEGFTLSQRSERVKGNKFFSTPSLPKFSFDKKKSLQMVVPALVVIVAAFMIFLVFKKSNNSSQVAGVATQPVSGAVKTFPINQEFKFPLTDDNGKNVGKFTYKVVSAELRRQIVIKGQSASAVPGREFLIINLQLSNSLNQGLQINTRDYIRVTLNGDSSQMYAPDIHNDPVEAQAISTTNTRVGLAINETDKNIQLHIGEINGKKTVIPLKFN